MAKQDKSITTIRGAIKRLVSVALCACIISTLGLSLTGCKLSRGLKASSKEITEAELARLVSIAIMSEKNVTEAYESIPESQLDGLTYSVFAEYCSVLRRSSQAHGTIKAFRILNDTEKAEYFAQIDSSDNENFELIEVYGDLDVVELCYTKDRDPKAPPVRFAIEHKNNSYILSSDYITDSMFAYSYINHYFEMIDENNIVGLESVIKSSYNSDIYLNAVVSEKAAYIADYYKMKVMTSTNDYELKLFSPTHISYEIPQVLSEYNDTIFSKTVDLYLYKNGAFCIKDDMPSILSELRLYRNGESKLRMGSTYSRSELQRLMGEPVVSIYNQGVATIAFRGLTIRLAVDDEKWTSGRLYSVTIRNSNEYTLGTDVYVGMNVSELLLIYPMFDECGYKSSFKNFDGEFILAFEFDDRGNVSKIDLGELVG